MKPEMKKLIIANLPYLLFVYLFGKLGQTYRLAAGADLSEKLLHLADGFSSTKWTTPTCKPCWRTGKKSQRSAPVRPSVKPGPSIRLARSVKTT